MREATGQPIRPWSTRGRGADHNPPNRFDSLHLEVLEDEDGAPDAPAPAPCVATTIQTDATRSILTRNQSPDIPFEWSLNPYRGCEHGCVYCFARPGHEALGYGCGLDFETRIIAKAEAPTLLRKALSKTSWRGQTIALAPYTDCYQPVESKLGITRRCLEVLADFRQSVGIITKSRLILRDLDLLERLNEHHAVRVAISVTTLDPRLARKLEPRASSPRDRLWAIRRLASAGIPVSVMVAPIIPALNDREIPQILEAAAEAGASGAGHVLLRLPHQIGDLFDRWLDVHYPDRKKHVLSLLKQAHGGKLYDSTFGHRMRGDGPYAQQIGTTFDLFAKRHGLDRQQVTLNHDAFRRPADAAQMNLFD